MASKKLLNLAVDLQALNLAGESLKAAKKPKPKALLKAGVGNIIGIELIKVQSKQIQSL